jgi:VWFA-related protein
MATVPWLDRTTVEPSKCGGKACIRGMRITVDLRQALQNAALCVDPSMVWNMQLSRRQVLAGAASWLATPLVLRGQDTPTFSADVKVVNVLATVSTRKGAVVRDLGKDDFVLYEDDRPQTVRYFSQESNLPLTLGLLVDTSVSQGRVMNAERGASFHFLETVLRPQDQAFLVQFDMRVFFRKTLTSSLRELDDGLSFVDTPSRSELASQTGGGTLLYDAVFTASHDVMAKVRGRKALIVLTDGVDTGSASTLDEAVDAAQRADTLIYSILFSDAGYYGLLGGAGGRRPLMRMSGETGGGFFEVSKKQGLDQIFGVIQDELRSQYSLGYVSDRPVAAPGFRRIRLTTTKKELIVQARDRYWAAH